jgi:hypothetical protein
MEKVCPIVNIIVKLKKKNHQQQLLKAVPLGFGPIADHGKCEAGEEEAGGGRLQKFGNSDYSDSSAHAKI